MGTKAQGDTCWESVHPDEPVFVLRAQDVSAPLSILNWIRDNFETASDAKLSEAFNHALLMRKWPGRRVAD